MSKGRTTPVFLITVLRLNRSRLVGVWTPLVGVVKVKVEEGG